MLNLFGGEALHSHMKQALSVPGCRVHWYGKEANREGRKMGHLTVTANSRSQLRERLQRLGYSTLEPAYEVGVIMGSDSDLPCMSAAANILRQFGVSFEYVSRRLEFNALTR